MLSRVAERVYWMARYLERVESTARLVKVYANLLLDLPRGVNIGWYNLVVLNSSTDIFNEHYKNRDERNVVKFMLSDKDNTSSMLSALRAARENIRTTRDVLPLETWELINELSLYASSQIQQGINRRHRNAYLDEVIRGVQRINGLINGTMSHDAAWQFLRLGRNLERADMTTRSLDAGASALIYTMEETPTDVQEIIWGNVLSSLSAYFPYRRSVRTAIVGSSVAHFLLEDRYFPRAVEFCLQHLGDAASQLPGSEPVRNKLRLIDEMTLDDEACTAMAEPFRDLLNDVQLMLNDVHGCIQQTWFSLEQDVN